MELDLAKPVVPHVMVRGELLNMEYKGLHTICFSCGVYGHREKECLLKLAHVKLQKKTEKTKEKS